MAHQIEDLEASARRAVESHLLNMRVHLLKLAHSSAEQPRTAWIHKALRHQSAAGIYHSPSMRRYLDLHQV